MRKLVIAVTSTILLTSASYAQPGATRTTAKPISDPNKVRCKSSVETGSLVKVNKVCHTNAEWKQISEQNRADAAQYRDVVSSSRGSN